MLTKWVIFKGELNVRLLRVFFSMNANAGEAEGLAPKPLLRCIYIQVRSMLELTRGWEASNLQTIKPVIRNAQQMHAYENSPSFNRTCLPGYLVHPAPAGK